MPGKGRVPGKLAIDPESQPGERAGGLQAEQIGDWRIGGEERIIVEMEASANGVSEGQKNQ